MNTVSLREFVSKTLSEIALGVKDANADLDNLSGHHYSPFILRCNLGDNSKIPGVIFDVAVVAADSAKEKAGFIVSLVNIGGGMSTEKVKGNEANHRIRFEVGLGSSWH